MLDLHTKVTEELQRLSFRQLFKGQDDQSNAYIDIQSGSGGTEAQDWVAMIISIFGHMMMFYLYKFYPVGMVMPFYSLFPIFGLILTFFIFGEVPSIITILGGIIVISSIYMLQKTR